MFVDKVQATIKAGDGGNGAVSFRHEKFIDKGGPDGGDGGNGGDVIFEASTNVDTLAGFRYQKVLAAQPGKPGSKRNRHGRSGEDMTVKVPVGTVVTNENSEVVADLLTDGQKVVIAQGGKGGFGNAHFVSSTRQAPRVAEKGEQGDGFTATLEMKMIAEVGLIGLPNAGKSTLLSVVSNAKPEIADYPFTTLRPNLGVVDVDDVSLLIADIPGLIEGASEGKGLGDEFLRHVERTKVLVHLLDAHNEDTTVSFQTVISELEAYSPALLERPQVVVLSKIDGLDEKTIQRKLNVLKKLAGPNVPLYAISSLSGEGVQTLLRDLKSVVKEARELAAAQEVEENALPVIKLANTDQAWTVTKEDKVYVVTGRKIERFADRTEFSSYHALQRLRDIMRKMGIMHQLDRLGAQPGDKIIIGKPKRGELEY